MDQHIIMKCRYLHYYGMSLMQTIMYALREHRKASEADFRIIIVLRLSRNTVNDKKMHFPK
jgi:hypothetical protein